MKERAIVWWLWGENHVILREFLRGRSLLVIIPDYFCTPAVKQVIEDAGSRVQPLGSHLTSEMRKRLKQESQERAAQVAEQMSSPEWLAYCRQHGLDAQAAGERLTYNLNLPLQEQMLVIEALSAVQERYRIECVVVNEDYQSATRAAVNWARQAGVPTLHLEHALPALNPYTVHATLEADYLLVSGPRARESYLDVGVPAERVLPTGFPGADKYLALAQQQQECRQYLVEEYGLKPELPIVVFGSTWHFNRFSAYGDPGLYDTSLEAFFLALNRLYLHGVEVNAVIKDRAGNVPEEEAGKGERMVEERVRRIGKRLGVGEHRYLFTLKDAPIWVTGSDVVVGVDSALLVEAMLVGTPAVNLANVFGLRYGPPFEADSGILEAHFDTLGDSLVEVLTMPGRADRMRQAMRHYAQRYNAGIDGRASKRVVDVINGVAGVAAAEAPVTGNTMKGNGTTMTDKKRVLHVGCGPENAAGLHAVFQGPEWHETRLDIDPAVKPEIIGSLTDMSMVPSGYVDAVWSSHNVEHLYSHQVPVALREFHRVLKPGGFALVTLPDLQAAAEMVAADQLDDMAYLSPAGPIAPIDMIYSYRRFLLDENEFMCHRTGFTARTLYRALRSAGFNAVQVERANHCLWATAWKEGGVGARSLSGLNGKAFVPQDDDEILAACRLWKKEGGRGASDYRTLHELRITAGVEQLVLAVLLERPEETPFIPYLLDLLARCHFRARVVAVATFPAPTGWQDSERAEWLNVAEAKISPQGVATKVLLGLPSDWIGLLKPAAPAYGRPQGVVSLLPESGEEAASGSELLLGVLLVDRSGSETAWKETLASLQRQGYARWRMVVLSPRPSPGGIFDASDDFGWLELADMDDAATQGKALGALVGITQVEWFTLAEAGQTFADGELRDRARVLSAHTGMLALEPGAGHPPWFHASLATALPEVIQSALPETLMSLKQYVRHHKGGDALVEEVHSL